MVAPNDDWVQTKTATEKALSDVLNGKVRLDDGANLGGSNRSHVYRFNLLDGPQDAPASVVVKRAAIRGDESYDPGANEGPAWRLFNDWAGLQFLGQVAGDASPAPRFYAGDREAGLIVLEDLSGGEQLDHILLGTDPLAAENALLGLATTLGRMHALTIGKNAEYDRIRDALGPRNVEPPGSKLAQTFGEVVDALSIKSQPELDAELAALQSTMRDPGPFLAYTHGDPCPDNCLYIGSEVKLLDFEFGQFRHALLDGVYGRIHFPTCWCVNRSPAHIPLKMEAAYRAELATGCPEAADDRLFYRGVVEACAFWAIGLFGWVSISALLEEDQQWGISTLRQRVLLRFGIAARTTQELGHMEAFGATAQEIAAKLRALWPQEADAMPLYPAFR